MIQMDNYGEAKNDDDNDDESNDEEQGTGNGTTESDNTSVQEFSATDDTPALNISDDSDVAFLHLNAPLHMPPVR
jgi:hypothetical protein